MKPQSLGHVRVSSLQSVALKIPSTRFLGTLLARFENLTDFHQSILLPSRSCLVANDNELHHNNPREVGEDVQPFFETEHMVIILIVFLTLVSGMCASIIVSCWGKIQERRRRKLEYHMKKSREASMEGQMNKVDQLYGSNDGSNEGPSVMPITASNNLKQRLTAPVAPSENHIGQQYSTKYSYEPDSFVPIGAGLDLEQQRQLMASGAQYGQHPTSLLMQQQLNRNNTITADNYGQTYDSGHGSSAGLQHQMSGNSNPNLNANFRLLLQQQQQQLVNPQERSMSVYGTRSKVSDAYSSSGIRRSFANSDGNRSSALAINRLAQIPSSSSNSGVAARPLIPIDASLDSEQQLAQYSHRSPSEFLNQTTLQQQQLRNQAYLASFSMHNDSQDSSSCQTITNAGNYFPTRQRAPLISNQQSISMPKFKNTDQQQMFLDSSQQLENPTHTRRRALTLSTTHLPSGNNHQTMQRRNPQAGIYGIQQGQAASLGGNNLSSSITCCNASSETPLINDLVKRANMQHPVNNRLIQMAQTNNAMKMQQQISEPASATATIPRSISAYQLSRSLQRQNQQQQQLQRQQLLLQQRQQLQSAYVKSMSDAGNANKHQPPSHSLSYTHACSGPHPANPAMSSDASPALPPPPPPPNLMQHQVGRSQTSCATLPPQLSDNKRQAFKVSRLDPSQLTGDTIPDSDLMMTNMPIGSMQFDDVSTESDATFGMLIDSVGNASLNFGSHINRQSNTVVPNQSLLMSQSYRGLQPISHLSECNLIRRQRAEALASEGGSIGRQQMLLSQLSCSCNCGALERVNQLRQEQALLGQHFVPTLPQQRQIIQTDARDFDMDSDEAKAMHAAPYGFTNDINGNNIVIASQSRTGGRQLVHMNHGGMPNFNNATHGNPIDQRQQMRLDRFRQQSSELTADDDEDVEDDDDAEQNEIDGFVPSGHVGQLDVDDEDLSSDLMVGSGLGIENQKSSTKFNAITMTPKSIVRRNEQELRDVDDIGVRQKYLSGSYTSICTCGSQAKLDMNDLGEDEDKVDGDSGSLNDQKASSAQTTIKSQATLNNDATVQNPSKMANEISTKRTPAIQQEPSAADRPASKVNL